MGRGYLLAERSEASIRPSAGTRNLQAKRAEFLVYILVAWQGHRGDKKRKRLCSVILEAIFLKFSRNHTWA